MSSGIFNKFTGYHNRKSIRLPGYDYSKPGLYFVTICIHDRNMRLFGDIIDGTMRLNDLGECAQKCLMEIPKHFPQVVMDETIIMPNHIHAIIDIQNNPAGANDNSPSPNSSDQYWANDDSRQPNRTIQYR